MNCLPEGGNNTYVPSRSHNTSILCGDDSMLFPASGIYTTTLRTERS